ATHPFGVPDELAELLPRGHVPQADGLVTIRISPCREHEAAIGRIGHPTNGPRVPLETADLADLLPLAFGPPGNDLPGPPFDLRYHRLAPVDGHLVQGQLQPVRLALQFQLVQARVELDLLVRLGIEDSHPLAPVADDDLDMGVVRGNDQHAVVRLDA